MIPARIAAFVFKAGLMTRRSVKLEVATYPPCMSDDQVTTPTILDKARELGRLIARHPASSAYHEALDKLENDRDAQRLLTDYNRQLQAIGEKEASGRPIEVEEKHKIRDLQAQVAMHPALSRLQMTQMDYLDLMRKVESAMSDAATSGPSNSS